MPTTLDVEDLLGSNVVLVTGKGGVGKTTVAATLALVGVATGRRTLLVEVEGRQGLPRLLATAPWDYQQREFRPDLAGTAIDPADAVYEYLELFYGIKRVQWMMERSHAIDFVTTAAPGLRDLLLVGKVYELEGQRRPDGRRAWDLIVVDAPPTGRIVPFLEAPSAVTEIVRVGPIRRQAGQIEELLHDPRRARAVVTTLLEEMPVAEAREGVAALTAAGIDVAPLVANQVEVPRLASGAADRLERLGAEGLAARAAAAGAAASRRTAAVVLELAREQQDRVALQAGLLAELTRATGRPALALPLLTTAAVGADEVALLAHLAAAQLGVDLAPPPHVTAAELEAMTAALEGARDAADAR